MANKVVKSGEEYEVMKQRQGAKTFAKVFVILWALLVSAPLTWWIYSHSSDVRNYAVVRTVYETNKVIMDEYRELSSRVVSKINISKYVSKIEVPEVKLDKATDAAAKANKAAGLLAAVGVKGADKAADATAALQKQVDKINAQIKDGTDKLAKTLASDINAAIKKELDSLAQNQMQKQLKLSDANYKLLVAGRYGILSESERKASKSIYAEFSKNDLPAVRNVLELINAYFAWIALGLAGVALLLSLVPAFLVWKVCAAISKSFTKCPYCGRVFVSKAGKLGILKLFKFW
jgi:hypothetical protein